MPSAASFTAALDFFTNGISYFLYPCIPWPIFYPQMNAMLCPVWNTVAEIVCMVCCSEFAAEPVHSGSGLAQDLTDIVHEELWSLNFDNVAIDSYQVLLSKLDTTKPNFVRIFHADDASRVVTTEGRVDAKGRDISEHRKHYNFAEYSPSGNVTVMIKY